MRRLFFDIEVSPNLVLSWRIGYQINLDYNNIVKERAIISIAWQWEGESKIHTDCWDAQQNDKKMIASFLEVANEADEIVAYFGDSFDIPWLKTRCVFHGLTFPEWKTCDPLQWARRKFHFNSNKLDYLVRYLKLGEKKHTDYDLWKKVVLDNDRKALKYMVEYNAHDVKLLRKAFEKLSLLVKPKTHKGVMAGGEKWSCPRCGSESVYTSKRRVTAAGTIQWQMVCKNGGYYSISDKAHENYKLAKEG